MRSAFNRRRAFTLVTICVALALSGAIVVSVIAAVPRVSHWSTLAAVACVGVGLVNLRTALRRTTGLFDPFVWIEAYALYFFGVAPILHVVLGHYIDYPLLPDDMRPWLGRASLINLVGLVAHAFIIRTVALRRDVIEVAAIPPPLSVDAGTVTVRRIAILSVCALVATVILVGGPGAYVTQNLARLDGLRGLGSLVLISDLLPMAIVIFFALKWWRGGITRGAIPILAAAILLQLLLSGLRGSRIQIVFSAIVCVGVVYGAGLRVRRSALAALAIGALAFSFAYTTYKDGGLDAISGGASASNERGLDVLLLGDLGRSDVQALLLWHDATDTDLPHGYGRTYAADVVVHVPSAVRPDLSGWSKVDYGTQWLVGSLPEGFRVGNIYGIAGEAVLNFGAWAFLPALIVWSLVTRWVLLWYDEQRRRARPVFLVAPFLCIFLITVLMSDLDQVIYMTLRFGFVPLLVYYRVIVGTRASPVSQPVESAT